MTPTPSTKGSCVRKRAGLPQSYKVYRRDLEAAAAKERARLKQEAANRRRNYFAAFDSGAMRSEVSLSFFGGQP